MFSHRKIEKGCASLLNHIGFSRCEDSIKFGGLVSGGFETSQGRISMYLSLVSPVDPNPDPKYKHHFHMKNHHDRLFLNSLEAAQNSLGFYQTANGTVLCHDTVSSRFPHQDHQPHNFFIFIIFSISHFFQFLICFHFPMCFNFSFSFIFSHFLCFFLSYFHFLSFSFFFFDFLSFSFMFFHFLSFSIIFYHFLSFSLIFFHFLSFSFMFFHFLFLCWVLKI